MCIYLYIYIYIYIYVMYVFIKSGFGACISSRTTTVIHVIMTIR